MSYEHVSLSLPFDIHNICDEIVPIHIRYGISKAEYWFRRLKGDKFEKEQNRYQEEKNRQLESELDKSEIIYCYCDVCDYHFTVIKMNKNNN